jgi:hypothetical protein
MKANRFPKSWDEKRVRRVLRHYESQSEDQAVEEDEKALNNKTIVQVPRELVPVIRELVRLYQSHGKPRV